MLTPLAVPANVLPDALPNARIPRVLQDRVTGVIVAAFFAVHRELGHGFSESVYQRALALEFASRGLQVEQEAAVTVFYKGTRVGQHRVPFIVEGRVLVDLRAASRLDATEERQLSQAIRASGCEAGLLLHFGVAATFRHAEREGPVIPACPPVRRPAGAS
jgi:GxxExxY protein